MNLFVVTDLGTALDYQSAIILCVIGISLVLIPPFTLYEHIAPRGFRGFNEIKERLFVRATNWQRFKFALRVLFTVAAIHFGIILFMAGIDTMSGIV